MASADVQKKIEAGFAKLQVWREGGWRDGEMERVWVEIDERNRG